MVMSGFVKFSNKFILILMIALLFCGCSHQKILKRDSNHQVLEEMRAYIKTIPDPERAEQLLAQLDNLKQDVTDLNRTTQQYHTDIRMLFTNYDATQADFRNLLDEFNTARKRLQQNILTSHFKMKDLTSPKEWQTLAELEEKAISKVSHQSLIKTNNEEAQ
jgi:septal ring factor EnvC (AmiA/AmiB activator)